MPKSRVVCSYRGCTNNKNNAPDKGFFKILKDSCRLWLELIGRTYLFCKPDHVIHNSTRIFADHFPESCYSTLCTKLRHCVCPRISGFRLIHWMVQTMGHNFDRICRLCTRADAGFQPIFSEASELCTRIRQISPNLQIVAGDGLPSQVCQECFQQVETYCSFRLQCEQSDTAFRYYLSSFTDTKDIAPSSGLEHVTYYTAKSMEVEEDIASTKLKIQDTEPIIARNLECTVNSCNDDNESNKGEKEEKDVQPISDGECTADCETESLEVEENIITLVLTELKHKESLTNGTVSKEGSNCDDGEEVSEELRRETEKTSTPESTKDSEHETVSEVFTCEQSLKQKKSTTQFKCKTCKLVLTTKEDLQAHRSEHEREKCNVCGKTFSDKYYYVRHMGVHMGVGYKCSECNKVLATSSAYRVHLRSHTGEKKYVCELCGKSLALAQGYRNHMMRHAGIKPFQCPTCSKAFGSKMLLQNHMLIHTGERPYICEICGTNFRDNSGLYRHMKTVHSDEKAYKCTYCTKSYKNQDQLKLHLRVHTGERPYECQVCGRTFTSRTVLNNHLRTHTGEKKYDCSYCEKKFSTQSSRTRHVRRHTGETPYECASCNKAFSLRRDLINHIQRFHP